MQTYTSDQQNNKRFLRGKQGKPAVGTVLRSAGLCPWFQFLVHLLSDLRKSVAHQLGVTKQMEHKLHE